MESYDEIFKDLYLRGLSGHASSVELLPGSGSDRKYSRIKGDKGTAIAVQNDDARENNAFLVISDHFLKAGLPVPSVYASDPGHRAYLLRDLGDLTLFDLLSAERKPGNEIPDRVLELYRKVLKWLAVFQVKAGIGIDYSVCYPRAAFDRQSMHWDLNYFKYYFLKLSGIPFDEQHLEDDFTVLMDFLLKADHEYFMYRDFQSRNIMIVKDEPFFIDYQGGRKGPLQYDVASLLYDAKADIPEPVRGMLLDEYLTNLAGLLPGKRNDFLRYYDGFVLIRILQALGAYGFRGYYEKKSHFLQSIPYAIQNIRHLLQRNRIPVRLPALTALLNQLTENPPLVPVSGLKSNLVVTINSFSYKGNLPADLSGNGGGFVFDCRALPNPGRYDQYKELTGKDQPVFDFLKKEIEVEEFLSNVFSLVDQSVKNYISRDFTGLMVSFGCTGGRHRSVYCAEALARHLSGKFMISIRINHTGIIV